MKQSNSSKTGPAGPVLGIKILDISTVIAAPLASTLLADFGAEVIKVEVPVAGDPLRHLPPHKEGIPLWTKVTNRNKRGITIDLRKPEGIDLIEKLIPTQDVLIENFRPGVLSGWGLTKDRLFELNPKLIILRVTGFGQTGPYANQPGFARVFEAMSGFADLCGEPDGPPMFAGFPISDALAGVFGALAITSALYHRERNHSDIGQEIDLSATEAMFRVLDFLAIEFDQLGTVRKRNGTRNFYSAPSDVYRTKDGCWISLAVSTPSLFTRLTKAIGQPELVLDDRFNTNAARLKNREEIEGMISQFIENRTSLEVSEIFGKWEVSYSNILNISEIFADRHIIERQAIVSVPDSDFGEVKMQCVVPRFSSTPGRIWRSGPGLGEHNQDVFNSELGLSKAETNLLKKNGVI
jgi:crotonobetainyl-CoA:carnitine CoA-transferase CaiB-like acyl-CoA transferase